MVKNKYLLHHYIYGIAELFVKMLAIISEDVFTDSQNLSDFCCDPDEKGIGWRKGYSHDPFKEKGVTIVRQASRHVIAKVNVLFRYNIVLC